MAGDSDTERNGDDVGGIVGCTEGRDPGACVCESMGLLDDRSDGLTLCCGVGKNEPWVRDGELLGCTDGELLGCNVGGLVGESGDADGCTVGTFDVRLNGSAVGFEDGLRDGGRLSSDGDSDGNLDGIECGTDVEPTEGEVIGLMDDNALGKSDGELVGLVEGFDVWGVEGAADGEELGELLGPVLGRSDDNRIGPGVGLVVGICVGASQLAKEPSR